MILQIEGGDALIVTNRHVVDHNFPSDNDNSAERLAGLGRLTVRILGQPDREGQVVWMAPGQIDLALVRAPCSSTSMAQAALWQKGRPMQVGESVFAIGNPHDLGWSHTQGVISQFRNRTSTPAASASSRPRPPSTRATAAAASTTRTATAWASTPGPPTSGSPRASGSPSRWIPSPTWHRPRWPVTPPRQTARARPPAGAGGHRHRRGPTGRGSAKTISPTEA